MTHTIYDTIKAYLEKHSYARERRVRSSVIVSLLKEKYADGSMFFPIDRLEDFAKDYVSYDRVFRLVQEEHSNLQGNDYKDGKALSQSFQMEVLGREVGYPQDTRRSARFTS